MLFRIKQRKQKSAKKRKINMDPIEEQNQFKQNLDSKKAV